MVLTIPDRRQRGDHECGRAALEAVFLYHGITPAKWLKHLPNPVQGTSPDTVEAALWAVFGQVCRGTMDADALRYWTRRGRPVLTPITDPRHGGHWVVVAGVERGRVHVHCPVDGPKVFGAGEWARAWTDSAAGVNFPRFGLVGWPDAH